MLERYCNLWTELAEYKCITTNGTVKVNGHGVMGAGCAGEFEARYPEAPKRLGSQVTNMGNRFMSFGYYDGVQWFMFPVKHNWFEDADVKLIKQSAEDLMKFVKSQISPPIKEVLLPRPGCGHGHLNWEWTVKPMLELILDDRIVVVHNGPEGS